MSLLRRTPAEVKTRVPGERVLAWAPSGDSSVIATQGALVLPTGCVPERVPWDLVVRVGWEPRGVEVVAQGAAGARPVSLRVPIEGDAGADAAPPSGDAGDAGALDSGVDVDAGL